MKIYNAADIEVGNNMYLIYGDGGTGKTSTAQYFEGKQSNGAQFADLIEQGDRLNIK